MRQTLISLGPRSEPIASAACFLLEPLPHKAVSIANGGKVYYDWNRKNAWTGDAAKNPNRA